MLLYGIIAYILLGTCGSPGMPMNGKVTSNGTFVTSVAEFTCNFGCELIGESQQNVDVSCYVLFIFFCPSHFCLLIYLQYRSIITSFLHAWCHEVFRVLIPNTCHGIYISMRRDVALPRVVFTRDVEFTRDMEFSYTRWKRDIFTGRGSAL